MGRGEWKTNTGFLLAAIGSAVGLGNIWRFPYVAYENGGGAFLIPYVIALFTAGIPILMLELSLGNKKRASAPLAFSKIDPKWEWLGWWSVTFVMFGIVLYYIVVIAWCVNYIFFAVFQSWGKRHQQLFFQGVPWRFRKRLGTQRLESFHCRGGIFCMVCQLGHHLQRHSEGY